MCYNLDNPSELPGRPSSSLELLGSQSSVMKGGGVGRAGPIPIALT